MDAPQLSPSVGARLCRALNTEYGPKISQRLYGHPDMVAGRRYPKHRAHHCKRIEAKYGEYVHIIPDSATLYSTDRYLSTFQDITGEVCVSDYAQGNWLGATHGSHFLGIILRGKPTYAFSADCWSEILPDGRRKVQSYHRTGGPRYEGWLVPADPSTEIVGFVTRSLEIARTSRYPVNVVIDEHTHRKLRGFRVTHIPRVGYMVHWHPALVAALDAIMNPEEDL